MRSSRFHDHLEDDAIVAAIVEAEKQSSGEIRVFVSRHRCQDAAAAAQRAFSDLGMSKTPDRNGVLLYFAPRSRKFAVIGDTGIHERCGDAFWNEVARAMESLLREKRFTDAVVAGIRRTGEELARHFPKYPGDRDDLPNTVARD